MAAIHGPQPVGLLCVPSSRVLQAVSSLVVAVRQWGEGLKKVHAYVLNQGSEDLVFVANSYRLVLDVPRFKRIGKERYRFSDHLVSGACDLCHH